MKKVFSVTFKVMKFIFCAFILGSHYAFTHKDVLKGLFFLFMGLSSFICALLYELGLITIITHLIKAPIFQGLVGYPLAIIGFFFFMILGTVSIFHIREIAD